MAANFLRRKPRWAVLISGRGSNLAALLELREQVDIRLVLSSRADAVGLLRAKRAGVAARVMPYLDLAPASSANGVRSVRKIDWSAVLADLDECRVTHVFLAGFMKLVPTELIERFSPGRIVNLHPSILPSYPGLKSIERAYADDADLGCTIHEVIEEVDAGRIICQRRSLRSGESRKYGLSTTEFLVHVDEQRIVRSVLGRWSSFDRKNQVREKRFGPSGLLDSP